MNYKVTTLAMTKISDCVNRDAVWLEYNENCLCDTLKTSRENDEGIVNPNKYVHYEKNIFHLI